MKHEVVEMNVVGWYELENQDFADAHYFSRAYNTYVEFVLEFDILTMIKNNSIQYYWQW